MKFIFFFLDVQVNQTLKQKVHIIIIPSQPKLEAV